MALPGLDTPTPAAAWLSAALRVEGTMQRLKAHCEPGRKTHIDAISGNARQRPPNWKVWTPAYECRHCETDGLPRLMYWAQ